MNGNPCWAQASEARVRTGTIWAAAVTNLGVVLPLDQGRPLVTVLTKKGRRSIENAAEIAVDLRYRFGAIADVELIDGSALSTMSIKRRVRYCCEISYCRPLLK